MAETIFALSSGLLPSGVAVIRVSGCQVQTILSSILGNIPAARVMTFGTLQSREGEFLDQALTVFFPAPHSFTGEDCAEFHLHGGKAVVSRFLDELAKFSGCRLAEAGEFSRRAFAEGKIDLAEAEGLADLIEAETESQRRLAVMGSSGQLSVLYRQWRQQLIKARALIEAELDFADEADVPGSVSQTVWDDMAALYQDIIQHIEAGIRASTMRDGLKIVLAGAPNSGKSSIINRLAGRDVAIVTDEAGTTRDALELRIVIAGLPVLITDTAGLRHTDNRVEKLGIAATKARVEEADLVILVDDMQDPQKVELPDTTAVIWHLGNKLDDADKTLNPSQNSNKWPLQISALTGLGFAEFIAKLEKFCLSHMIKIGEAVPARKRQLKLLQQGADEIKLAYNNDELDLTLRAEHLRLAAQALGRITGEIDVEDMLDVIFSEFCIGK